MAEQAPSIAPEPAAEGIRGLEKRNWQTTLFVVLTTLLLVLVVLALVFPGVLDYLQQLRAEGDLDRYTGLLVLVALLYCFYVLRMHSQLSALRQHMVEEHVHVRGLRRLVGQLERLIRVASTVHLGQPLDEKLRVLAHSAKDSLNARAVSVAVKGPEGFGPFLHTPDALLTETQAAALFERLKDSPDPVEIVSPSQLAALWGSVPPELGTLMAVPLRNLRETLGVMAAEFAPAPGETQEEGSPQSRAELELLRVFSENAVIAIENDRLVRKIEHMAITDELTGLFNRRYFNQELEREILRTNRLGRPFALLLFDIDHFKDVNDTYGHSVGDEALRRVAWILNAHTRRSNLLARHGGEEFASILLETGIEGALGAAERMRQAVARIKDLPCRITVSAGIAIYPQHARDMETLVRSADQALYAAKHAGRNRVCIAEATAPAASQSVPSA